METTVVSLPEALPEGYVVATYCLRLPAEVDVLAKAEAFAVGQSTGTWLPVPGLDDDLRSRHEGRLVGLWSAPPLDMETDASPEEFTYFLRIALPTVNFGSALPMLLTTLLGNDASTSVAAKLVDLELPDSLTAQLPGPQFGIDGLRRLTGVADRPLLLNMIKPCAGLTPEQTARIFYDTALGGIDLIKDDELIANPPYSHVERRVTLCVEASARAFEHTGVRTLYIPNISDRPDRMLDNAKRAVEAGALALMVTYATVGYGGLQSLAESAGVPVFGHFAGSAPYFEGAFSGMSAPLAAGLLPRLAGADMVLTTTPYGGYRIRRLQYLRTVQQIRLPRPNIRPAMPVIGGGVHPGTVPTYLKELGADIILGAGGAIQGHPAGAAAGVKAMRAAVEATMASVPLDETAAGSPELAAALGAWGTLS